MVNRRVSASIKRTSKEQTYPALTRKTYQKKDNTLSPGTRFSASDLAEAVFRIFMEVLARVQER